LIAALILLQRGGTTQVPLTIEFTNALIHAVSVQDAAGSSTNPVESISFAYQKATWKSNVIDPVTGAVTTQYVHSWDIASNTGT
jgi:type VI protein secretion system component Hcp